MDLQVFGKNVDINDSIKDYAKKKIEKLTRYLSGINESKIEITEEKTKSPQDRFTVQITIRSRGNLMRAEEKAPSINLAIDDTVNALARQISRYKGKFENKRKSVVPEPTGAVEKATNEANTLPGIVRVKRFLVKSMSIQQATEQMELLSHDFFLFLNDDSGVLNLIYRRKDGNYGLIEPELDID